MQTMLLASYNIFDLFGRFPAGIAQGLIWGVMAIGVFITFRLLDIADLSVDGSFAMGGCVAVMLVLNGAHPWLATLAAFAAGTASGFVTGILHTKMGIPAILAGILTQYALYSVNLMILGMKANQAVSVDKFALVISGRTIPHAIMTGLLIAILLIAVLYGFFGTELGSAIRATGCNQEMSKAQGINISRMKVIGLALSNGLVAFSGAMSAQYSGFADVNAGRGAIVIGLAAVIIGEVIGEALLGKHLNFAGRLSFVVIGGVIYYLVYTLVLWLRIDSNLMKMFTAIIVAVFLAAPYLRARSKSSFGKAAKHAVIRGRREHDA